VLGLDFPGDLDLGLSSALEVPPEPHSGRPMTVPLWAFFRRNVEEIRVDRVQRGAARPGRPQARRQPTSSI